MDMSPEKHINKITGQTYNLLRNIRVVFTDVDEDMIKKLIMTLLRPRLEYETTVWSPSKKNKKTGKNTESSHKTSPKSKGTVL